MLFWKKKHSKTEMLDLDKLPKHIAIIMDGNGRWAKRRGLPRSFGHREGAKALINIAHYCSDIGIKYLTVYAFSTENWKRPKDEVEFLMDLIVDYLRNIETHMGGKKVKIKIVGDKEGLPAIVQEEVRIVEEKTSMYDGVVLNLALNYGSRHEITNALKKITEQIIDGNIKLENINEELISNNLYTNSLPDPELLIRPGGEYRVSNFLLWQCAYTEIYYTNTFWPDFKNHHIDEAIIEFQRRNRRFGGI